MLPIFAKLISCDAAFRAELKKKYLNHNIYQYDDAKRYMYNNIDCQNGELHLIYGGNSIKWECGGTKIPSTTSVNAEHIVPESFFSKRLPMVSDLHHLISAPCKLNNKRGNYKFGNFSYDQVACWCINNDCTTNKPYNPDDYSCLSKSNHWMPRVSDRGEVARAVLYWFTMYDDKDVKMEQVGDLQTFINWAKTYPPSEHEINRNNLVNQYQGNVNPYIVDPSLVDPAWVN
ncbi:secreted nuclease, putative [Trichomonas vaginalis G3]|uniref:Secreted nuclease, putative n=1 Tax=Trichomonas vaginalis (strain ATCC PRA-98 / G3) TaxID=412133 RepID=A2FI20_TRIV3|nr:endonuclease I family [Trichomonas vaginalis G3]EAX95448.1 secreted nuclease, putative [Trichomonas vaginalis G3]KAI5542875.1 endonuclease I family [Trichomonas vaginalis G3]|eukprot:XP_001308378.1 secreted nuclease [Trichomonas vaginalis G3]